MLKPFLGVILLSAAFTGGFLSTPASAATQSKSPSHADSQASNAAKNIHRWRLNGKIAVQTADNAGSATLKWIQRNNHFSIALSGAMGSTALLLAGQPGSVTMMDGNGRRFHAESPEELLASQWGFHLPVSNMIYWVRGLPVPDLPATTKYDKSGRLVSLSQQGFRITYSSYAQTDGAWLPQKLAITSSRLRVKMIVYNWSI